MEKEIKIVIQFEPIFDTTNKSGHTIALIHKYNFGGHFTMEIPYTLPGNPKKIWESSRNSLNKKFQESQNLASVPSAALFYKILVMVLKNSLKSAKKVTDFDEHSWRTDCYAEAASCKTVSRTFDKT